jgi:hypothetical protein
MKQHFYMIFEGVVCHLRKFILSHFASKCSCISNKFEIFKSVYKFLYKAVEIPEGVLLNYSLWPIRGKN